jgi:hypothetical protein
MAGIDYFRRVPRDFTEGTSPGTLMSIVATCVMGGLFALELQAFMDTTVVTDVVMDDAGDGEDIQINFDLSMPDLVCQVCAASSRPGYDGWLKLGCVAKYCVTRLCRAQYASIDVSDMMGTNRRGITRNIVMRRVDSQGNFITNVDYT